MAVNNTRRSRTSHFGVGRRESHDASAFYNRRLYRSLNIPQPDPAELERIPVPSPSGWSDRIYLQSAERMDPVPDNSVGLALTSPPYNANKAYDEDLSLEDYLQLIRQVGAEVYRTLRPGGRYLLNVAALGRKPYIPMQAFFWQLHIDLGFLPMGEIIWQKAEGANGSCAWGSWMSARSPRLRDVHEYILVMAKQDYSRPDSGESDIDRDGFMESTLSVWKIRPESARRVGHPAPFPLDLARRAIRLYTFTGDVVLDPFIGSGTTAVAAVETDRRYVGFEIEPAYVRLAEDRIRAAQPQK
jgi:site-specific DNA-methyltransferase (adenine-specific)